MEYNEQEDSLKVELKKVVDSLEYPFYVVDLNYEILLANEAARKRGIVEGEKCYEKTHMRDTPCEDAHFCPLKHVLSSKKSVRTEHIHFNEKGDSEVMEVQGVPVFGEQGEVIQMIEYSRDITDRKKAEAEIADSYRRLTNVLDSLDSLVYVADFKSYELLFINKYGRDMFGDAYGRKCWQVIQKDQKGPCSFCTNDKLISDAGIPTGIYRWEFKNTVNGRWYECRDKAIPWTGKKLVRMEIATDITDRKRAEDIVAKTEKLTSLGRIASEIAHEINNPLMVISGNAQISLVSGDLNADAKKALEVIIEQCQAASDITHRILRFANPGKGETKEVEISKNIEDVVRIIEKQFKSAGIHIRRIYPKKQISVSIDSQLMQEVYMNLLNNAKDAMPAGGTITVTVSSESGFLRIDFKDTGSGMSEEVKKNLFEPFFTTKEGGTGLGLSICYSIIRAHNGELRLESQSNKGTTVTILLPV